MIHVFTGLVFSEYLLSGQVPSVKNVNDEEPLFPAVPSLNLRPSNKVSFLCFSRLNLCGKLANMLSIGYHMGFPFTSLVSFIEEISMFLPLDLDSIFKRMACKILIFGKVKF